MSVEQAVVNNLRALSPEAQREVLDFTEFLRAKVSAKSAPLEELRGLWADLGVDVREEDFAEARREMWGAFPRDLAP